MTKFIIICLLVFSTSLISADWPQFRGIERNGSCTETGLLKIWPSEGPKLIWSFDQLGAGWSSAAIANNKIYITGNVDEIESVFALDLNGKLLWKTEYGPVWNRSFPNTRTTPTVDGNKLYVFSSLGNLACLSTVDGKILWQVQTAEQYKGEYHRWGMAESPLIIGDLVIATPGGANASVVAFNKNTGKAVWQTKELSEQANYCSPICVERGAKKIIITNLQEHVVGIDAANGKVLWKDKFAEYQSKARDINPNSPLYNNGYFYITSGYDSGSAMYKLSNDGLSIERVWEDQILDNHHGHVVKVGNYIYGANWLNNRDGNWVCLEWETGKVMYEKNWQTKGSIITADGMLYCFDEKNANVALVKADPTDFKIASEFTFPFGEGEAWAHPSISDGRLYIRRGGVLAVYDIKK